MLEQYTIYTKWSIYILYLSIEQTNCRLAGLHIHKFLCTYATPPGGNPGSLEYIHTLPIFSTHGTYAQEVFMPGARRETAGISVRVAGTKVKG